MNEPTIKNVSDAKYFLKRGWAARYTSPISIATVWWDVAEMGGWRNAKPSEICFLKIAYGKRPVSDRA
jgi:hypothetical protein